MESLKKSVAQREREMEAGRQLNKAVQALITKIRGYAGLDGFLLPLSLMLSSGWFRRHHQRVGAWPSRSASPQGCRALERVSLCSRFMQALDYVLSALWISTVKPVIDALGLPVISVLVHQMWYRIIFLSASAKHARARLWWCMTDELGFQPIQNPCRREKLRFQPDVYRWPPLRRVVLHPHACLAYKSRTFLDAYCHVRGMVSRGLST
jgi:hypothetical protein